MATDRELAVDREDVLAQLYKRLTLVAGVTRQNERFTVRWNQEGELVSVSLIVTSVTTVADARAMGARSERYQKLFEQHPELEADIYYAENGEWPK